MRNTGLITRVLGIERLRFTDGSRSEEGIGGPKTMNEQAEMTAIEMSARNLMKGNVKDRFMHKCTDSHDTYTEKS